MIRTTVLREAGFEEAMLGLSLSYGRTWSHKDEAKALAVASKLAPMGGGHNKFLESMVVWLDIDAPRFFWQEFDTYRVGVTKQSESTMHTLKRHGVAVEDFDESVPEDVIDAYRALYDSGANLVTLKGNLPEGFMQRRIVCTNYMALRRIFSQRFKHRLPHWREFLADVVRQISHPLFVQEYEPQTTTGQKDSSPSTS